MKFFSLVSFIALLLSGNIFAQSYYSLQPTNQVGLLIPATTSSTIGATRACYNIEKKVRAAIEARLLELGADYSKLSVSSSVNKTRYKTNDVRCSITANLYSSEYILKTSSKVIKQKKNTDEQFSAMKMNALTNVATDSSVVFVNGDYGFRKTSLCISFDCKRHFYVDSIAVKSKR